MKVIRRANEPQPWTHTVQCDCCRVTLEIGADDLCHDPCGWEFSVDCCECGSRVDLATLDVPEDVKVYVAGRAARARAPGRVA